MNDKTLHSKNELLNWLLSLEDEEIILKLMEFKTETKYIFKVSEPQAEYAVKDDFDERFAMGISGDELLKRVFKHIDTLPWKK